jgi:hypothetical protein
MNNQLTKYGINHKIHTFPRYSTFKDKVSVVIEKPSTNHNTIPDLHIGATISFVNSIKDWYENTDEQYAIFCEDDVSFESIDHWNFTWQEFYSKLPIRWQCLQLIRMNSAMDPNSLNNLTLNFRWGRWWGSSFMIKRSHAKRLLNILHIDDSHYRITSQNGQFDPCVENCLSFNYNTVCNFPLLIENNFEFQPVNGISEPDWAVYEARLVSNYIIRHHWKTLGKNLNLEEVMKED